MGKGRDLHLPGNTNQPPAGVEHTCTMTSVPHGGSLEYKFDPDPVSVDWEMGMGVQLVNTRGGQVAYPITRTIGNLNVMGYFRSRKDLLDLSQFVQEHMLEGHRLGIPVSFIYPERDIDFSIFISALPRVGFNGLEGEVVQYGFTGTITQDHSQLTTVPLSELGVPENIDWIDVATAADLAEAKSPNSTLGAGEDPNAEEEGAEEDKPKGESSEPPAQIPGRGARP